MAAESLKLVRGDEALVVEVENNGNAASFAPIVELFLQSGPNEIWRGGSAQLPPVYPHSSVTGGVPWSWQELTPVGGSPFVSITAAERFIWIGHLTAVCYDPSLDPKPAPPFDPWGQPAHHRKILTIPYWSDLSDNP